MDTRRRLDDALAGHYRIERLLGEGGMALVYLAEDLKHRRLVAIKVLRPELSAAMGAERFLREIETVARLNHPNILSLHDSGEADGLLYFVMPFVEGESLRQRLERESRLPLGEAVRITREIGDALQYAHDHGLVHRDIKPENILFQAGHAVVCDFGIAQIASEAHKRLTRTGLAVGTVTYMSPEQLSDTRVVDRRTDLYALGCLLHEMLSGEAPFSGATPQAALASKLTGKVADLVKLRPDLPGTVQVVLERALAVDSDVRYPSTEEFTGALAEAVTQPAVEHHARQRRRRRTLQGASVGTVLILMAAAVQWFVGLMAGPALSRLAVLPFQVDSSQTVFDRGAHQDLVLELARAGMGSGLRVINPASVDRYAGTSLTVREIAADLSCDGIVQGYARMRSGGVTVDLQLVDGVTEEILWTQTFQANLGNLVTMYRQATRAIADFLGLELSPEASTRLAEAREIDPQVYDALVNARFNWQKLTGEGIQTALNYYELALELSDSLSAEAWVGIAMVWGVRAQQQMIPGEEANRIAEPALARALELDPSLAGVQSELASRRVWAMWDWAGAEEAYQRAIDENPTDSPTRGYYAHFLLYLDRDEEALEQLELAAELDPFSTLSQGLIAMGLNFLHRFEEAEATLRRVLEREPESPILLSTLRTTYHLMGRHEDALAMWRASYGASGDTMALAALQRGQEAGGYSGALEAVADLMVERSATRFVTAWSIATLYTRAGQLEKGLDYLEQAFETHNPNIPYITVDPIFDPMRDQPRFQTLVDRLALPRAERR